MILATYLSTKLYNFPTAENEDIKQTIKSIYGHVEIKPEDYAPIIELLKYDKKNEHGNINFVLLENIGETKINCLVENELIIDSFHFYNN